MVAQNWGNNTVTLSGYRMRVDLLVICDLFTFFGKVVSVNDVSDISFLAADVFYVRI